MREWFTIDRLDPETWCISEYRHWEETHCYLLNGARRKIGRASCRERVSWTV